MYVGTMELVKYWYWYSWYYVGTYSTRRKRLLLVTANPMNKETPEQEVYLGLYLDMANAVYSRTKKMPGLTKGTRLLLINRWCYFRSC